MDTLDKPITDEKSSTPTASRQGSGRRTGEKKKWRRKSRKKSKKGRGVGGGRRPARDLEGPAEVSARGKVDPWETLSSRFVVFTIFV